MGNCIVPIPTLASSLWWQMNGTLQATPVCVPGGGWGGIFWEVGGITCLLGIPPPPPQVTGAEIILMIFIIPTILSVEWADGLSECTLCHHWEAVMITRLNLLALHFFLSVPKYCFFFQRSFVLSL